MHQPGSLALHFQRDGWENQGHKVLVKPCQRVEQIRQNPNIALAIGNLKVEAVAELFGHPSVHPFFLEEYPKKFPHLGKIYSSTPDDLLIIAKPIKISLYKFIGKPCEDVLEIENDCAYRIELK